MKTNYKLNVLWIDDEPSESFIDDAADENIVITNKKNVEEGLKALLCKDCVYDAIILDANCLISPTQKAPGINALQYAITQLYSKGVDIPWFVYTGGAYEGKNALNLLIPDNRPWDDRKYYEKDLPGNDLLLFQNIWKAATQKEITKVKLQYADVLRVYQEKDLIDLLVAYHTDKEFGRNATVPNTIRSIVEWTAKKCDEQGILATHFIGTNISEVSKNLGNYKMNKFVPCYIARAMHLLSEYCNAGSHRYANDSEKRIAEGIRNDIANGVAPYLNRMAVNALLNLLLWWGTISSDEETIKNIKKQAEYIRNQTEEN